MPRLDASGSAARALDDVARGLPFTLALVEELQNFQVKVTEAANEAFGALGDGYHDDLVLAIMIGTWAGEHVPRGVLGVS